MRITRNRAIITRNENTEIWCGGRNHREFRKVEDIGDCTIVTFLSVKKAEAAVRQMSSQIEWMGNASFIVEGQDIRVVPVIETLETDNKSMSAEV